MTKGTTLENYANCVDSESNEDPHAWVRGLEGTIEAYVLSGKKIGRGLANQINRLNKQRGRDVLGIDYHNILGYLTEETPELAQRYEIDEQARKKKRKNRSEQGPSEKKTEDIVEEKESLYDGAVGEKFDIYDHPDARRPVPQDFRVPQSQSIIPYVSPSKENQHRRGYVPLIEVPDLTDAFNAWYAQKGAAGSQSNTNQPHSGSSGPNAGVGSTGGSGQPSSGTTNTSNNSGQSQPSPSSGTGPQQPPTGSSGGGGGTTTPPGNPPSGSGGTPPGHNPPPGPVRQTPLEWLRRLPSRHWKTVKRTAYGLAGGAILTTLGMCTMKSPDLLENGYGYASSLYNSVSNFLSGDTSVDDSPPVNKDLVYEHPFTVNYDLNGDGIEETTRFEAKYTESKLGNTLELNTDGWRYTMADSRDKKNIKDSSIAELNTNSLEGIVIENLDTGETYPYHVTSGAEVADTFDHFNPLYRFSTRFMKKYFEN